MSGRGRLTFGIGNWVRCRTLLGARLGFIAVSLAVGIACCESDMMSAQGEEAPKPKEIQYTDLEGLVKEFSPQVQVERIQLDHYLGRYERAGEEMEETRRLLRAEAASMEQEGDAQGAERCLAQAKTLEKAVKKIDQQIRSAKGSSGTMSLRQMEDTMTWTAQNLMGTYYTLKLEQEGAKAREDLARSSYEKVQRQISVGGASPREAEEAEQAASEASRDVRALLDEKERIKKDLAILLGYETGDEIEILSMPAPDSARIEGMNLKADQWKALGNNYELRAQRGSSSAGSNKALHSRQREMGQKEAELYARIEALYQKVMAEHSAWKGAVTAMEGAEAGWKADSHKMELGMLSDQEYLEARAVYLEAVAAKGQADVKFQQAMEAYDWAVKGLVQ